MQQLAKCVFQALALLVLAYCGAVLAQVCAIPGKDSATATISGIINSYSPTQEPAWRRAPPPCR